MIRDGPFEWVMNDSLPSWCKAPSDEMDMDRTQKICDRRLFYLYSGWRASICLCFLLFLSTSPMTEYFIFVGGWDAPPIEALHTRRAT